MKKVLFTAVSVGVIAAGPLAAGHNNPWAGEDDNINSQFHEENLAKSENTPGEDEMQGVMTQNARGKLVDASSGRTAGAKGAGKGQSR